MDPEARVGARPSRIGLIVGLIAVLVIVAGCQFLPTTPIALQGTAWRVVDMAGQAPVPGSEPTVVFADGGIQGTSGCNSYGGAIQIDGAAIKVGDLAMTLVGCGDRVGEIEGRFVKALSSADRAAVRADGMLVLSGPDGEILLRRDGAGG